MASTFTPVSGVSGIVTFGDTVLNAATYDVQMNIKLHECPTFKSPNMFYAPGRVGCVMNITGTWDFNFNPFSGGIALGAVNTVQLNINSTDLMSADYSICAAWHIVDNADGTADYNGSFVIHDTFTDFGDESGDTNVDTDTGSFTFS